LINNQGDFADRRGDMIELKIVHCASHASR
jgi:hypothetical protein